MLRNDLGIPERSDRIVTIPDGKLWTPPGHNGDGTVNEDPAGRGWFLKIRLADKAELDGLLSEEQYQDFVKTLG